TVPALICGSFSDNNLHGRGSFRGWEGIASTDRFLYTHRAGKWATFYSAEARAAQLRFFDRYLRGHDVPAPPAAAGRFTFAVRSQGACWEWTAPADTEITGPMALRLWVEAHGA